MRQHARPGLCPIAHELSEPGIVHHAPEVLRPVPPHPVQGIGGGRGTEGPALLAGRLGARRRRGSEVLQGLFGVVQVRFGGSQQHVQAAALEVRGGCFQRVPLPSTFSGPSAP